MARNICDRLVEKLIYDKATLTDESRWCFAFKYWWLVDASVGSATSSVVFAAQYRDSVWTYSRPVVHPSILYHCSSCTHGGGSLLISRKKCIRNVFRNHWSSQQMFGTCGRTEDIKSQSIPSPTHQWGTCWPICTHEVIIKTFSHPKSGTLQRGNLINFPQLCQLRGLMCSPMTECCFRLHEPIATRPEILLLFHCPPALPWVAQHTGTINSPHYFSVTANCV